MEIPIKHRDQEVEYMRIALAMGELYFSYETVHKMQLILGKFNEKKEEFDLKDAARMIACHEDMMSALEKKMEDEQP